MADTTVTKPTPRVADATRTVTLAYQAAQSDNNLKGNFLADLSLVLYPAGFALQPPSFQEFNRYVQENHLDLFERLASGDLVDETDSWLGCKSCKIGIYAIAAAITAAGATGLAVLTESSAVVISLATFAGVETATALAFIRSLIGIVSKGVSAVADSICSWVGAC